MAATIRIIVSTSGGLDDVRRDIAGLGESASRSGGGFNALREVATGAFRFIGEQAVQAAAKLAGFVGDSIGVAANFEEGMNQFAAAAGDSLGQAGLDVKDFSDLFVQLGKDLPVSTKEVQDAAITLVKGGIDPLILKAGGLESSLNFAAAAGMGLADAAELSIKQLGTFVPITASAAEQTRFLAEAQDLMVKAAGASTLDVDKLGAAMLGAGGQAKAMNLDYKDFVTTMGLISPSFSSAETAGTSYKNFLVRLIPTTKKATATMVDLGLMTEDGKNKFFDATGAFVGNEKAAQLLQNSLKGLSAEQRTSALQTIFGNDAMGAAVALADAGAAGYDAFAKKMAGANGVMAQAEAVHKGFNNAMTNLKGSMEAVQIVIGTALLPILTPLINKVNAGVGVVLDFVQGILGASDPMLAFAESLTGISPDLSNIAFYLIDAVRTGDLFTDWLTETPPLFQGLVHIVQDAITEFGRLSDAFSSGGLSGLTNVLTTDIAAALPVIQAQLMAWGQAFIDWIAPYIPPLLAKLEELVIQAGAWIIAQEAAWVTQLMAWGQALIVWVTPMIPPLIAELQALATQAWGWVVAQAPGWLAQLQAWGQQLVAWIAPMIPPALAALEALGIQLLGWITAQAAPILASLSAWAQSFVAWIPGATVDFLQRWPVILNDFLNWIATAAVPMLTELGKWAIAFVAWILPNIPNIIGALAATAAAIIVFLGETVGVLALHLKAWGDAFVRWIAEVAIPGITPALGQFLSTIGTWITNTDKWLWSQAKGLGDAIIQGLINGVKAGVGALEDAVSNAANDALNAAKSALGISSPSVVMAAEVGSPMVQGIIDGLKRDQLLLNNEMQAALASAVAAGANAMDLSAIQEKYQSEMAAVGEKIAAATPSMTPEEIWKALLATDASDVQRLNDLSAAYNAAMGGAQVFTPGGAASGGGGSQTQTYNNQRQISVTNNYVVAPPASYSASLVRSLGGV
jgi:TP901 family phage tail tape measure protein